MSQRPGGGVKDREEAIAPAGFGAPEGPPRARPRTERSGLTGDYHRAMRTATDPRQMARQRDEYASQLDAADQNNRFVRRRDGLGQSALHRYNELSLFRVRETYRHMADNDSLPGSMTRRLADHVVQSTGFTPKPNTGDPAIDNWLLDRFARWASDPDQVDYYGRWDFPQMQWHLFRQTVGDGETLCLPLDDGRLQPLEIDHLVTPLRGDRGRDLRRNIPEGVSLGFRFEGGRPVSAFLAGNPVTGPWAPASDVEEVRIFDERGFRQVLHLFSAPRMVMWRAYSDFTPVMVDAGMLDDVDFATLVKAQNSSNVCGVVRSPFPNRPLGSRQREVFNEDNDIELEEEIRTGTLIRIHEDENLEDFTASVVSNEQMAFSLRLLRKISAGALDMPYEMALLDGSITNFSGWKGGMDVAKKAFRRRQRALVSQFHCHVWQWRVRQEIPGLLNEFLNDASVRKRIRTGEIFRHNWVTPTWESVQRLQDAAADEKILANNLDSPRQLAAARTGRPYEEIVRETVEDNGRMIEAAIVEARRLRARHEGENVDWREVVRWNQPAGLTFSGSLEREAMEADR